MPKMLRWLSTDCQTGVGAKTARTGELRNHLRSRGRHNQIVFTSSRRARFPRGLSVTPDIMKSAQAISILSCNMVLLARNLTELSSHLVYASKASGLFKFLDPLQACNLIDMQSTLLAVRA